MDKKTKKLMNTIAQIAREEDMKVTISSSLNGALMTAASTFVGGLLFGSKGILLGGAVGAVAAATGSNEFRPLAEVIMNLSDSHKAKLSKEIMNIGQNFDIEDLFQLCQLIMRNENLKNEVMASVIKFVENNLGYLSK